MIITKREFCAHVEEEYSNNKYTMIDTVIGACDQFNVDPDLIEPLINRSVKEKMKIEYISLNYIKAESNVIV